MNNTISKWANTQATAEMDCPHCKALAGNGCIFPSGRLTHNIHGARSSAYVKKIGRAEFDRRHSGKPSSLQSLINHIPL